MKLVSNCSPLIFLAKLNSLELLSQDHVWVSFQVKEELLCKESEEKDKLEKFLSQKNVSIVKIKKDRHFSLMLGKGEMAAICLSLENKIPDVLLDDRRAYSLAKVHNLKPHGTLWIILRAYANKLIARTAARELIYELPAIDFRIDQKFLFQILKSLE